MNLEFSLTLKDPKLLSSFNFDQKTDSFYLTGSSTALGEWNIDKAILLDYSSDTCKWSTKVSNFDKSKFSYKYLIASKTESGLFLKKIEFESRCYPENDPLNDLLQDEHTHGWLLENQFELHLNLFNKPLSLYSKTINKSSNSILISPYKHSSSGQLEAFEDLSSTFTVKMSILNL
jgi:hypothetical protein